MKITETELPGVLLIEPRVFSDDRGFFLEIFQAERYPAHGVPAHFAQDNMSRSVRGTLRGLHFQEPNGQGKLVQVMRGEVFDVVVDVRRHSPTFGKPITVELSGDVPKQLWIPPGFAHGFCVTSETADFWYKCTRPYMPECERSIRWDDPALGIVWPVERPLLSKKDAAAPTLAEAPALPSY
ncbi:MAG: dTDP-4-dehydrorhamnose 3,5-epimerase [bacterium]|nr:dTDP-4-dehydrorhamnose 3,5-epimerase [bacterium]